MGREKKRRVRVILTNGEQGHYYPTHRPVRQDVGSFTGMMWEQEDGSIFSVAINKDNIVAIEMATPKEDQDEEVLDLIERAKQIDS